MAKRSLYALCAVTATALAPTEIIAVEGPARWAVAAAPLEQRLTFRWYAAEYVDRLGSLLQRRGVTLDAVCVGNETSDALRAIAKATGGYCFQPERLRDALKLCELETLLTLFERPDAPRSRGEAEFGEGSEAPH